MTPALQRLVPAACALLLAAGPAAAVTLYDPALGTLPSAQGWLTNGTPGYTQSIGGGTYNLSTTAASAVMAGSALTGLSLLDTAAGFELDFSLRVLSEAHDRVDRGGYSVIFTGLDPRLGLELAFWDDRVFAYTGSFVHGAEALLATTATTSYALKVAGNQYTLSGNGVALLGGSLVDYTAFGLPYTTPGFLFFGDDTSSARSSVALGAVSVSAIPEPASAALLAAGLGLTVLWSARHRRLAQAR